MMQPASRIGSRSQPVVSGNLEQSASFGANASAATNPFKSESLHPTFDPSHAASLPENAALSWQAPVSSQAIPLRRRDLQVLTELFDLHEIEAIESDILENLGWRCPEPCWEDNPFEFLREYL